MRRRGTVLPPPHPNTSGDNALGAGQQRRWNEPHASARERRGASVWKTRVDDAQATQRSESGSL